MTNGGERDRDVKEEGSFRARHMPKMYGGRRATQPSAESDLPRTRRPESFIYAGMAVGQGDQILRVGPVAM